MDAHGEGLYKAALPDAPPRRAAREAKRRPAAALVMQDNGDWR